MPHYHNNYCVDELISRLAKSRNCVSNVKEVIIRVRYKIRDRLYQSRSVSSTKTEFHSLSISMTYNVQEIPLLRKWILKHSETESVYASESDFGCSLKVFLNHPY